MKTISSFLVYSCISQFQLFSLTTLNYSIGGFGIDYLKAPPEGNRIPDT